MRKSGHLVMINGKVGVAYHNDKPINGKVVVTMLDKNHEPIIVNSKPRKLLVKKEKLTIIGLVD